MIPLCVLAGLGAVVALGLGGALLLHWNACRRVKRDGEAAIERWYRENGYGEMGP